LYARKRLRPEAEQRHLLAFAELAHGMPVTGSGSAATACHASGANAAELRKPRE